MNVGTGHKNTHLSVPAAREGLSDVSLCMRINAVMERTT